MEWEKDVWYKQCAMIEFHVARKQSVRNTHKHLCDACGIQVSSQAEYDSVVESFPFHDRGLEQMPFPKKFPLSPLISKVYQQVKEFIYACLKFSEDPSLSLPEAYDMIRKSTRVLLTRSFSVFLSSLFRKSSITLLQVIQVITDTGYLEEATVNIEEFVSNITSQK